MDIFDGKERLRAVFWLKKYRLTMYWSVQVEWDVWRFDHVVTYIGAGREVRADWLSPTVTLRQAVVLANDWAQSRIASGYTPCESDPQEGVARAAVAAAVRDKLARAHSLAAVADDRWAW